MKLSNASLRVWDYGKCFRFYACEALAAKGVGFVDRPSDIPGWGVRAVRLRAPEERFLYACLKSSPLQPIR